MHDSPEEVERLAWEIHDMHFRYHDLLTAAMPHNPGYTQWAEVFSSEPANMLQCDFAYMLGPEMFDRFVAPQLRASCQRFTGGAFFHQDGVGQLCHTKSLHAIPELAGVQWQPGAGGHPSSIHWHDQQRRIRDDGKLSQTWGNPDELESLAKNIGDISHCLIIGWGHVKDEARYREVLRKLGAE